MEDVYNLLKEIVEENNDYEGETFVKHLSTSLIKLDPDSFLLSKNRIGNILLQAHMCKYKKSTVLTCEYGFKNSLFSTSVELRSTFFQDS